MKILFFARRFYPDIGGVEKHVLRLSQELIKRKHSVVVIAEKGDSETQTQFEYEGISVYKIPVGEDGWAKKFRIWIELWKLRKLISSADIIHCHDVFFWYLPFRFLYYFKRVYMTFHGYESFPIKQKAIWIRKLSEKLTLGNICIGDFISKWYGTQPTFVSYGAVDMQNVHSQLINIKQNSALFYGRLDAQTGIKTYLDAYKKIKKRYPLFKFCVIGEGYYKKFITKDLIYYPFIQNPTIYFSKYQFAFLSRYLSILEAFSSKRLVFAVYDNPVKKDYLMLAPYARFIVTASNADELYEKVAYYIDHPNKKEKLIKEAYTWVKKQSWEKLTNLYLSLWKQ